MRGFEPYRKPIVVVVKMTKSWKILNIFLKKPSLDMGPITKVVAYAKKTLEIRGFLEIPDEGSIYGPVLEIFQKRLPL